jgi:DNA-directed RNA polymerase specialized sigma24 family protein
MLSIVQDAEDVVRDVYVRFLKSPDKKVDSSRAYVASAVTRACIDGLRAATVGASMIVHSVTDRRLRFEVVGVLHLGCMTLHAGRAGERLGCRTSA